jgi:hypothetical protein
MTVVRPRVVETCHRAASPPACNLLPTGQGMWLPAVMVALIRALSPTAHQGTQMLHLARNGLEVARKTVVADGPLNQRIENCGRRE